MKDASPGPGVPCLYEVTIVHTRQAPLRNSFRHRSYMWMFDPQDPPRLPGPLRCLARYRASDHVDVPALLAEHGIEARRILVLTNLRVFGYVFNPISIYWCYDDAGNLAAHVAEVHNTYGSRHAYVLPVDADPAGPDPDPVVVSKAMYVSPFHPVDGDYRIAIGAPGETVSATVVLDRGDAKTFRATVHGRRHRAGGAAVTRLVLRYPAAPLRGRALIQLEGLRLWRKGLEVHPR